MTVAALRVGFGLAALVSPGRAARPWVGESATTSAGRVLGRAAGARDLALGAGALLARRGTERPWVLAAAACDVVDAATTLAHWRALPSPGRALVVGGAVGAAAVGLRAGAGRGRPTSGTLVGT